MFKVRSKFYLIVCVLLIITVLIAFGGQADAYSASYKTGDYQSNDYQTGYDFGIKYKNEIVKNVTTLINVAETNGTDMKKILGYAQKSGDLYKSILPEKMDWIKGISDATEISYDDLLIFNFSDKAIVGLYGECTTFMAQGSTVEGGGTIILKNRDQSINTLSEVTVQENAKYPKGEVYNAAYIDIPQVEETYKFVGSKTAGRWGYGMGINEYQVIVADNDANSRDYLQFEEGLHDNDVIRLILERAKTAREGVTIAARLIEEYGQAWNGIIFEIGDPNELWVMEVTGKRWVAKRYIDTITARSNQYQITTDYDFGSADLYSFAYSMGWHTTPKENTTMNFRKVYGTLELYPEDNSDIKERQSVEKLYNTEMRYQRAIELLNNASVDGSINLTEATQMCRDHYDTYVLPSGEVIEMSQIPFYSHDMADWYSREWVDEYPEEDTIETALYVRGPCGHDLGWGATSATGLLYARTGVPDELGLMLHSFMQPCMSTFVPFYVGIDSIDLRYSTPEAASLFNTIATKAFGFYTLYHDGVRKAFDPYEEKMINELSDIEKQYMELLDSDKKDEAVNLLNDFTFNKGVEALNAAEKALEYMKEATVDDSSWEQFMKTNI